MVREIGGFYKMKKRPRLVVRREPIAQTFKLKKSLNLNIFAGFFLIFGMSFAIAPIIYSDNIAKEGIIIQKVSITGDLRYTKEKQLTKSLEPLTKTSILFVDLNLIQNHLEAIPSIHRAKIRRHWPYRLDIHLTEQSPIARWGSSKLINNQGEIFESSGNSNDWIHLPRLDGPRGTAAEVIAIYRKIKEVLNQTGEYVSSLKTGGLGQLEITLNGGTKLFLKKENFLFGLRRFISLSDRLNFQDRDIERVDLRYVNGFAIALKEKTLSAEAENLDILQEMGANG